MVEKRGVEKIFRPKNGQIREVQNFFLPAAKKYQDFLCRYCPPQAHFFFFFFFFLFDVLFLIFSAYCYFAMESGLRSLSRI
eukprot:NODE_132_length_1828_cov_175.993817_g91_i0.p3 GENE.NODE_132_length_1828_cov_175.993817_g91_i0~~NODE_132_length_1828_cov_175.993817_g91_i0.p3  ORF type:complete len:81 (+),score=22.43 NODE_132_length_1828_cov_175.993817_g91_i0:264-506(+)